MSENNDLTVRQTVLTVQLWPHGLVTPRGSRGFRREGHSNPFCFEATLPQLWRWPIQQQCGLGDGGEEYIILVVVQ